MANGQRLTPPLTSRGLFEVQEPFELDKKKIYEVVAIREFDDLWAEHADIFATYYEPYGLSEEIYNRDVMVEATIVSIKGEDGIHYIPDTFIISYPELGLANYNHVVISASLGALNNTIELSGLMNEISEICSKFIGVKADVKAHIAPIIDVLTTEDAKKLELVRRGYKDVPLTSELKYREQKARNDAIIAAYNQELLNKLGYK